MVYLRRVNKLGRVLALIFLNAYIGDLVGREVIIGVGSVVGLAYLILKIRVDNIHLFNRKKGRVRDVQ